MLRNKYTDTSVQKGDIPGFSSYVDHTSCYKHENCSPNLVPVDKDPGSDSLSNCVIKGKQFQY